MRSTYRLLETLIREKSKCGAGASRCYYTNSNGKATLYSKISPLGDPTISLSPELDRWIENGNKVGFVELQRIIHHLRKSKRFGHALEVSEWMKKIGIFAFSPIEHAVQLELIGRVRGFLAAETYFNNLRDQDKTDKTYGALLHCYVRQCETKKSFSHLQKMKEMGYITRLAYNNIMSLYTKTGQHEKVPDVLAEMKSNKVSPDNFSYKICINSYGVRSDIEGVDKILREIESRSDIIIDWSIYTNVANIYIKGGLTHKAIDALRKAEMRVNNKDGIGYNHLISLYAILGNKIDVLRLWDLEKRACKRCLNIDYINMLHSLVRLGELEEAEKLLKEWEGSGNCYDFRVPYAVITGFSEKGLCEKAEAILVDFMEKGMAPTPNGWAEVAGGYQKEGRMDKAKECMKAALSLHGKSKGWKPNPKTISSILSWLGDKGSIDDVESFVGHLRTVIPLNREMYHALLKANIRGGKEIDELLRSMKADNITEDEETKRLLGLG